MTDTLVEYEWDRTTGLALLTYEKEDGTTYQISREQTAWWSPLTQKEVPSGQD